MRHTSYLLDFNERDIPHTTGIHKQVGEPKKVRKKVGKTRQTLRIPAFVFLHITTILIIKRLTCSCTLECLLGLFFLAHSPSSDPYFPHTSPDFFFFFCHRARNNIETRPPVPDEFLNFKSHSPSSYLYFETRHLLIKYFTIRHHVAI